MNPVATLPRLTLAQSRELLKMARARYLVGDRSALPPIERQFVLRRDDGCFVARIDIAMPSVRLGLEAHSRQFHFGPDAEPLDEQRDLAAAACGWELAYLGWYASKRPKEVVAIIRLVVAARQRDVA